MFLKIEGKQWKNKPKKRSFQCKQRGSNPDIYSDLEGVDKKYYTRRSEGRSKNGIVALSFEW